MRDPNDVLTEKIDEYKKVLKEIEALRVVLPLLVEPEPEPKELQTP